MGSYFSCFQEGKIYLFHILGHIFGYNQQILVPFFLFKDQVVKNPQKEKKDFFEIC